MRRGEGLASHRTSKPMKERRHLHVLTRWATTASFFPVLRHPLLIASLVFLFSLGGILNAFAHCPLEHDLPIKISGQIPVSISCLDNQEHLFLTQRDQREKRISFPRIDKRLTDIYDEAVLPGKTLHLTRLQFSASILVPLSVPIYQAKNVYRI